MWSGVVTEKNLALSADQGQLQFSVHLIDLLSINLRYNGFTRIQKTVVIIRKAADHQTMTLTLFWCEFGFRKCFGASSQSSHWAGHRQQLSYKIHFSLYLTIQSKNGSLLLLRMRLHFKTTFFFFWLWSAHEAPTYQDFSPAVVTGSALMIALYCSLPTSDGWPLSSSSSRVSSPLQNVLSHQCTVCSLAVPGPDVLLWVSPLL